MVETQTTTTPNALKDTEQQEHSFIATTATLEDNLAVSHKTKYTVTLISNNYAP